ncbi:MAG: hypothetical protein KBC30_02965 [Planctomycetes bacterium]|nr:hypothetical protein [Planctomycetota bacterium]
MLWGGCSGEELFYSGEAKVALGICSGELFWGISLLWGRMLYKENILKKRFRQGN